MIYGGDKMHYFTYDEMYRKALEVFKTTKAENPINYELIKNALRKRPENAYKGSCGSLTICAGSTGLTGAACLSSMAALRSGCGLVTLCCAEELNTIFEIKLTEVMTKPVKSINGVISADASDDIIAKLNSSDALLYGPGLSWHSEIKLLLEKLLVSSKKPVIIDADGLNVLSEDMNILKKASCPVILTPHVGEFARMSGYDKEYILNNAPELALEFARKYGVILILKSHATVVSDGTAVYQNILGNPGMAVGGSGDVLSGLVASFAAQSNTPLISALAGVYIHSLAADMAVMETGEYSLLPSDMIKYIIHAMRESTKIF